MSAQSFWSIVVVLVACNGLVAWSAAFKDLGPGDRPRIVDQNWFRLACAVGGTGWVAIPVMFAWRYGILEAAISLPVYILVGILVSFLLKGAIADLGSRPAAATAKEDLSSPASSSISTAVSQLEPSATRALDPPPRPRRSEFSYEKKVSVLRSRIDHHLIESEKVTALLGDTVFEGHEAWQPSYVERLETGQTWWVEKRDGRSEVEIVVHVRNTTERTLSALVFELWDTPCKQATGTGRRYVLRPQRPIRSFEDRALKFLAALPADHGIRRGLVCGKIVGAR